MARGGQFRKRAKFSQMDTTARDILDNPINGWAALGSRPARLIPLRGNERGAGSGIASVEGFELQVRDSEFTRSITTADRVEVDGVEYQIRAAHDTEKPGLRVFNLERGVAT